MSGPDGAPSRAFYAKSRGVALVQNPVENRPLRSAGWVVGILAALVLTSGAPRASSGASAEGVRALFLGDNGHHQPALRARDFLPRMANRGIDVTYSDRQDDLDPDTLSSYDCLIIYANAERITPDQEKALLDYVAGGKGLVAVHCASYCFLNSPAYIALVGAQFNRHGTGVFTTDVTDGDHQITGGFEPFETWDETYVHHKHNPDRRVLMMRAEGDRAEPWTWVRTHGKGRVFYTAYGHDDRTWSKPGFLDLIERGVRWSVGKPNRAVKKLEPFAYREEKIAFYAPGGRSGRESGSDEWSRMQLPVPPAESMKHMRTPTGFALRPGRVRRSCRCGTSALRLLGRALPPKAGVSTLGFPCLGLSCLAYI